jgi:hypothetical protein
MNNSELNFDDKNLNIIKSTFYILIFICVIIQILINNNKEYYFIFLQLISNLIVINYCLNKKVLFNYPISTFVIFLTNIFLNGGALFFKTLFLESVSKKLKLPNETLELLLLCNIYLIITHVIYRRSKFLNDIKNFFSKMLIRFNVDIVKLNFSKNFGYICIILVFIANIIIPTQRSEEFLKGNLTLYQDIINGVNIFSFGIFLIIACSKIYKLEKIRINYLGIIFFSSVIIITAVLLTGRSLIFDNLFSIFLIFIFSLLLGYIKINNKFLIKFVLFSTLIFVSLGYLEIFSQNLIKTRENTEKLEWKYKLNYFVKNYTADNSKFFIDYYNHDLFPDNYYSNTFLNRINLIYVSDSILFASQYLSRQKIEDLKNYEISQIISVIPKPLIGLVDKNFDKKFYTTKTITSALFMSVDSTFTGPKNVGSMFALMKIYYGYLFFLYFLPFVFLGYILLDFFLINNKSFSPILFLIFYHTGGGLTTLFTVSSFSVYILILIRLIPQTIILYIISYKIYSVFVKTKY